MKLTSDDALRKTEEVVNICVEIFDVLGKQSRNHKTVMLALSLIIVKMSGERNGDMSPEEHIEKAKELADILDNAGKQASERKEA
jgi:hypothetical protein